MQINLRQVVESKQLRRRLQVTLQGGSQLVQISETKAELDRAVSYYQRVKEEVENTGGIILRDGHDVPRGKLLLTADGNLQLERIVQEQRGTPKA